MANKVDQLRGVPLFSQCTKQELEFLASRMDEVDLPNGRTLIEEGRPGDTFYVLLSGEAEVRRGGRKVDTLRTGDFFGEISMLDRGPATATVVTSQASQVMVLSHAQFRDAIKANDSLAMKVMAAMAERLRTKELEEASGARPA
jgi:CRP-like cAMP-binding protein